MAVAVASEAEREKADVVDEAAKAEEGGDDDMRRRRRRRRVETGCVVHEAERRPRYW